MLEINPTFRDLIPPLSKEEYAQLEANCLQDGIMHPIITWRGQIIDGHNRYNIVQEHGIDYRTEAMEFESEADAIVWIIQHQMGRRNLNAYNRSVLALKMEGVLKEKGLQVMAEKGKEGGRGNKKEKGCSTLNNPLEDGHDTKRELTKLANVSVGTLHKVKAIEAKATPEQKQALATGEESIHSVYKQVQAEEKREERRKKVEQIKEQANEMPESINLLEGDLFDLIGKVKDNTIDLLNTDPPYMILKEGWDEFDNKQEFLSFTERWLHAVMPKLKPTARAYISFATYYQYDFYKLLEQNDFFGMNFRQTIIWYYKNNNKPSNRKEYRYMYEPIFYLYGKEAPPLNFQEESYGETQQNVWEIATPQSNFTEGKFHPAQKPLELYRRIISTGSYEGDTVLDCFAGSGTTGIICKELGRKCIMIEREQENCKIIKGRV